MEEVGIRVSIYCLTYNHEAYIRNALKCFVKQKTNFRYEVIVHDDASTDKTPEILKEYAEKYPDIFKVILQKENQYSQGVNVVKKYILPIAKGDYIAVCEGDDYWCSEDKLQKQYDTMISNTNCSMVVHNTIRHDVSGMHKDSLFFGWKEVKKLEAENVFWGWFVHTSSYFAKREIFEKPEFAFSYWFGDYVRLCLAYHKGDIICLPDVMSVYNWNVPTGVTRINSQTGKKLVEKESLRISFLEEYNSYTNYKYDEYIRKRVECDILEWQRLEFFFVNQKKYCSACRKLRKHPVFRHKLMCFEKKERMRNRLVLLFPCIYYYWSKFHKA